MVDPRTNTSDDPPENIVGRTYKPEWLCLTIKVIGDIDEDPDVFVTMLGEMNGPSVGIRKEHGG